MWGSTSLKINENTSSQIPQKGGYWYAFMEYSTTWTRRSNVPIIRIIGTQNPIDGWTLNVAGLTGCWVANEYDDTAQINSNIYI